MSAQAGRVTFSVPGHTDLTLRIASGYAPEPAPGQNVSKSGGGVIRTVNYAPALRTLRIPLKRLDRTEYQALVALIEAADYSSAAMTITDPFETHERMHYIRGIAQGSWSRGDLFSATLEFQQSAADFLTSNIIV